MVADDSFSKTICSICYEDLKPNVEDLQSISICGHVFHELCIQQWFEYNANTKKLSCPVCKQRCSANNACRLYFQSTGDATDPKLSQSRSVLDGLEESPEVVRREVKKLESRVSVLNSTLDHRQEELKRTNEELHLCKEQLSNEVALKVEALKQKERIQESLRTKSSEFVQSSLECSRLQEKNLALAKELAGLKLLSDFNLGEEDILKLATLGNEFSSQDTADVLKKSLFIRNKSYKELMAKCSSLGRGEARFQRKLEKAKEKIIKLKTRIQELESTIEEKDNEVLRAAKASKKKRDSVSMLNVNKSSNTSPIRKPSHEIQIQQFTASVINLDEDENMIPEYSGVKENENKKGSTNYKKADEKVIGHVEEVDCEIITGEDMLKEPKNVYKTPEVQTIGSDERKDARVCTWNDIPNTSTSRPGPENYIANDSPAMEKDVGLSLKSIKQASSLLHDKKEVSSPVLITQPADRCFAGGLLGPDGNNRYLGKWCKRVQAKVSTPPAGSVQGSTAPSLISVGADGRGGRVKVLRHPNQTSADDKENSTLAKRCKVGSNTSSSSLQSRGCLQIDHFFGRVNRQV